MQDVALPEAATADAAPDAGFDAHVHDGSPGDGGPLHGWSMVGDPIPVGATPVTPVLYAHYGRMLLAYDDVSGGQTKVLRWDGWDWEMLGSGTPPMSTLECLPSLSTDDYAPFVGHADTPNDGTYNLHRWNGTVWHHSYFSPFNAAAGYGQGQHAQGCPVLLENFWLATVLWNIGDGTTFAPWVTGFNQNLGKIVPVPGVTATADEMFLGSEFNHQFIVPVLSQATLFEEAWNGAAWVPIADPIGADPGATLLAWRTAFDWGARVDTPHLALTQRSANGDIYLRALRFTSGAWQPLGTIDVPADHVLDPRTRAQFAFDGTRAPVIAFGAAPRDPQTASAAIYVRRWNGASWDSLGDISNPVPGQAPEPLAFSFGAHGDGPVFLAFVERRSAAGPYDLYVERYDP